MIKSIKYFEDDFMKEPTKIAEYVLGVTDELHKLGLEMIKESLESMDQMLQEVPFVRKTGL